MLSCASQACTHCSSRTSALSDFKSQTLLIPPHHPYCIQLTRIRTGVNARLVLACSAKNRRRVPSRKWRNIDLYNLRRLFQQHLSRAPPLPKAKANEKRYPFPKWMICWTTQVTFPVQLLRLPHNSLHDLPRSLARKLLELVRCCALRAKACVDLRLAGHSCQTAHLTCDDCTYLRCCRAKAISDYLCQLDHVLDASSED